MASMLERLRDAQNAHDAERMAALFAEDYRSVQPVHPNRAFTGRSQVLINWTAVFEGVPDFTARIVSSCVEGEVEWGELDWRGTYTDGSPFAMRGVALLTIRDDLIAGAHLYMELVEQGGGDIEASLDDLYRPGGASAD
jgi:ketosteroid isomerase-like protein